MSFENYMRSDRPRKPRPFGLGDSAFGETDTEPIISALESAANRAATPKDEFQSPFAEDSLGNNEPEFMSVKMTPEQRARRAQKAYKPNQYYRQDGADTAELRKKFKSVGAPDSHTLAYIDSARKGAYDPRTKKWRAWTPDEIFNFYLKDRPSHQNQQGPVTPKLPFYVTVPAWFKKKYKEGSAAIDRGIENYVRPSPNSEAEQLKENDKELERQLEKEKKKKAD